MPLQAELFFIQNGASRHNSRNVVPKTRTGLLRSFATRYAFSTHTKCLVAERSNTVALHIVKEAERHLTCKNPITSSPCRTREISKSATVSLTKAYW